MDTKSHPMLTTRKTLAMLLIFAAGMVSAQSPIAIQAFGNFTHMAHTGDTSGKVKLGVVGGTPGTLGVGALAG
jgi:hypothetical protein